VSEAIDKVYYGVYTCQKCGCDYTVNRLDTWASCTPELCHDCLAEIREGSDK
jgi:hypothetical protein